MFNDLKKKQSLYLKSAAEAVERQALENPGLGIPVDPDVADYMGAFFEDTVDADDLFDDDHSLEDDE